MKRIITALTLFAALSIIACTKGGKLERISGVQYTITSTAGSKQLVPAIDTSSAGTFTGFYDEQSNILTFTITWNDLWRTTSKDTITSVNFYGPATAATNGALVRALPFVSAGPHGLLVHDGYRPWYVTKAFWDARRTTRNGWSRIPRRVPSTIGAAPLT